MMIFGWWFGWLFGWLVGWSTSLGVAWRELPPTDPLFQTMIRRVKQGSETYAGNSNSYADEAYDAFE